MLKSSFLALVCFALALSACGDDDVDTPAQSTASATTGPNGDDVQVIRDWAEALSDGDVQAAAEFFALPSVAENGGLLHIEERDDAILFNQSLPCGAKLESTEPDGEFITATFRLDRRPGVPACPGEGETAMTNFKIEDGLIVEWRRVPGLSEPATGDAPVQTT
jgi:hypothetical protein